MAILADQAAVEHEANQWAGLRQENRQYERPIGEPPEEHFLPLMPRALVDAAETSPINTALGCDNTAPRACARLSEAALTALVGLLLALGRKGEWVVVIDLVLMLLVPKKTGGRRPIGLFPTLTRIWMRARVIIARVLEAANTMPCTFGGAGMGAQKAALPLPSTGKALRSAVFTIPSCYST